MNFSFGLSRQLPYNHLLIDYEPLRDAVKRSIIGKTFDWSVECGELKGSALGGALEVAVEEYIASGLMV